ncbi:MAG TPA: tripartite tricarboxylate transporter substrate-binding protein [Candidatus Binatia bacterium]|nr:tripartite tricarboxylate transporter substrate-binding protein [Candidatus Binatia bacterium]
MKKLAAKILVALVVFCAGQALAQDSFYNGKTIKIIVGFSAGGGYDTYARLIARHMTRHIQGNPTIVVENMAGAGSLISANHLYKAAKPDGLTIGHFIGGLFIQQLLEKPGIEFDARKFEYIGVPAQDNYVTAVSKTTGVTGMQQWLAAKTPLKIGGIAPGTATSDIPRLLMAAIDLPAQVVDGYKGTADVRLAFNSGEIVGVTNAWESFKSTWRKEVGSGDAVVVVQHVGKRHPELPNVPLDVEFAKTPQARQLLEVGAHSLGPTARPFVLPPGTPKGRVQILRKAYADTMKDAAFLAEAKKANLDINPSDGAELEGNVKKIFTLEASLIARLKEILK